MAKVLIATTELIPSLPYPAVGGGQRAFSLGEGLRSRGHEVIYSLPMEHLRNKEGIPPDILQLAHSMTDIDAIVGQASPDVVIFTTAYLMRFYSACSVPAVLDLAANIELEATFTPGANPADVLMGRLDQYSKADLFILGSPRQIPWFSAFWMLAGLDLKEELYTVVPICCSPDLPPIPERRELSFISAGMFYPWQNPFDALQEVLSVLDDARSGELVIYTGKHPTWAEIHSSLIDPRSRLGESEMLDVRGLLPFDKVVSEWGKCACAVDVMKPNLERRLANPMRTTTYLWLGIPVIISDFYWISELVKSYDAGWLVDPLEKGAVKKAVQEILRDPDVLRQRAANAQRLVAENLTWDRCVEGLDAFCRSPRKLRKSTSLVATVASEVARMSAEQVAAAKELGRVQEKLEVLREKADRAAEELKERNSEVKYLRGRIEAILNSRTWRTVQFVKHKLLRIKQRESRGQRES
ncbi:MAG TPA: glycosyltransferase family 4 protein [bacterium]|nr:glycosyltransferase family 4 protein [bacterium]